MGEVCRLRSILKEVQITVVSENPPSTRSSYKVASLPRGNLRAVIPSLLRTDLFILGGGGLIKPGFARSYGISFLLARALGSKTMVYAVSAVPLRTRSDRSLARLALEMSEVVSVRDALSRDALRDIGTTASIQITTDSAFNLDQTCLARPQSTNRVAGGGPYVVLSLRQWDHEDLQELRKSLTYEAFMGILADLSDWIVERYGVDVITVPMQVSGTESDVPMAKDLRSRCKLGARIHIIEEATGIPEIMELMEGAEITIGMRLHSVILSIVATTPFVSLAYSPKVDGLLKSLGLEEYMVRLSGVRAEALKALVSKVYEQKSLIREELRGVAQEQHARAADLARTAVELLQAEKGHLVFPDARTSR